MSVFAENEIIFVFLRPPAKSTSLCSSSGVMLSDLETVQLIAAVLHYRFYQFISILQ